MEIIKKVGSLGSSDMIYWARASRGVQDLVKQLGIESFETEANDWETKVLSPKIDIFLLYENDELTIKCKLKSLARFKKTKVEKALSRWVCDIFNVTEDA